MIKEIHRIHQMISRDFEMAAERQNLPVTMTQAMVLSAIAEHEGGTQTALVHASGIDRSTLADVIRRLVAKGLVKRVRTKKDARAYAVTLTSAGDKVEKQAAAVLEDVTATHRSKLGPKQDSQLTAILAALSIEQVAQRRAA